MESLEAAGSKALRHGSVAGRASCNNGCAGDADAFGPRLVILYSGVGVLIFFNEIVVGFRDTKGNTFRPIPACVVVLVSSKGGGFGSCRPVVKRI